MAYIRISFILIALIMPWNIDGISVNDKICGSNEEFNNCGKQCERTCADVDTPGKLCNHMCAFGCFCIDGYVRKYDENSPCIKENEC